MSEWDAVREEGERISREEAYKVMAAEVAALHAEIARLHERLSLWEWCAARTREMYGGCFTPEYAAKVRELASKSVNEAT